MKIAFNPSNSSKNILDLIKTNKDIIFDLKGHSIYARGVEFKGIDTNTWRDIKINNVSIGSNILDLRNGTNTTLTNTNGVVTINSTWRPVVDNLTSNSTTSSLSANQGRFLKALIDGKSDSDHNHDGRYVRAFGTSDDNIDSDWGQSFKTFDPIPSGTPPEKNPNISLLSIGENFSRRKQLAFVYSSDNIYYRRHVDDGFTNWKRIAFANEIPSSLKNPYSLTLKANGTTLAIYDGSSAKEANFTYANVGAASASHYHTYIVAEDLRYKYPAQVLDPGRMKLSFLAADTLGIENNGTWYDVITVRSYKDSSGGHDNALLFSKNTNSLYHTSFSFGATDSWGSPLLIIDSGNIRSQTVANAYHLYINSANSWSTWYWAGQSGQPSWLWGSNDGTNMYLWNPSNFNVHTAQYLRSLGNQNCQTGRTQAYGDVYTYNTYNGNTGSPTSYTSVIGFGRGIAGTVEIAGGWCDTNLYWRSLRDCCEDWHSWRTVLDSDNYTEFIGNYYWANVKVSLSPSTTTSPTVYTLTATRVCAGHNPGIDNSISCSNWFRSSGATGWYNTTYEGGWYMSDTSWIRAHNDVGIYTGGQIYSSSSIRMSNIYLEHTDEINSTSGINLNYRNSSNVSLCYGGGNVGIGTMSPTQRLDVVGNIRATGQIIREGSSQVWVNGRNGALLRETSVAGYHTLWSLKTTDGSWDFGEYNAGSDWNNIPVLSYVTDSDYNSGNNTPTYQIRFPLASGTVALTSDISTIPNPTNCYWANVKISTSANTQTTPSVNTIFANNWFRSQGDTGWYNESYGGGIRMTDTEWIRTFGGKSFYCDNQISSYGFHHLSHDNNDAVLLAGGGYGNIFTDKSYNYTDNSKYNLTFHKLSSLCNNLVWVEGYVTGSISIMFSLRNTLYPEYYGKGPDLFTVYAMGKSDSISIDGIGIVRIKSDGWYRVGFFYQGIA